MSRVIIIFLSSLLAFSAYGKNCKTKFSAVDNDLVAGADDEVREVASSKPMTQLYGYFSVMDTKRLPAGEITTANIASIISRSAQAYNLIILSTQPEQRKELIDRFFAEARLSEKITAESDHTKGDNLANLKVNLYREVLNQCDLSKSDNIEVVFVSQTGRVYSNSEDNDIDLFIIDKRKGKMMGFSANWDYF